RRKENTGKQKPKIHIIKPGPQGLELLKSYRLGALTSIELVTSDTTGRSFLLVFDEKTDSSQPQWTTRTVDDRNQLVFLLLKMCKDYLMRFLMRLLPSHPLSSFPAPDLT
ncbi:unnamed protein product, partial [Closterium sp. NIES-54]